MTQTDIPSKERNLVAKQIGQAIVEHILDAKTGCGDVERASERLADLESVERVDSITALTCSNCGGTVPGVYWTELDMDWRCPHCGLRNSRNDGVRR